MSGLTVGVVLQLRASRALSRIPPHGTLDVSDVSTLLSSYVSHTEPLTPGDERLACLVRLAASAGLGYMLTSSGSPQELSASVSFSEDSLGSWALLEISRFSIAARLRTPLGKFVGASLTITLFICRKFSRHVYCANRLLGLRRIPSPGRRTHWRRWKRRCSVLVRRRLRQGPSHHRDPRIFCCFSSGSCRPCVNRVPVSRVVAVPALSSSNRVCNEPSSTHTHTHV